MVAREKANDGLQRKINSASDYGIRGSGPAK
jgi:hypothetical protein